MYQDLLYHLTSAFSSRDLGNVTDFGQEMEITGIPNDYNTVADESKISIIYNRYSYFLILFNNLNLVLFKLLQAPVWNKDYIF